MKKFAGVFVLALLISVGVIGYSIFEELRKAASDDPSVWAQDIQALAAATREASPPEDAILFVGSSSIRLWSSLAEDMGAHASDPARLRRRQDRGRQFLRRTACYSVAGTQGGHLCR